MHTKSMASDLPVVELLQAFIRYASGGDSSDAGFSCVLDFLVFWIFLCFLFLLSLASENKLLSLLTI